MCGIAGAISFVDDMREEMKICENMQKALLRRGPDQRGIVLTENAALIHTRLAVIDIQNGRQPMKFTLGEYTYIIVYNGEIYNTAEVRKQLEEDFEFETASDTEVVLKSFVKWGAECVDKLNGIFAFVIWDEHEQRLFMARDRIGVKPFFYWQNHKKFIFASEIKALFQYPGVQKILDKQGICELFGIGPAHTPGTTIFNNIFELKPAHFAIFNRSGLHIEKYWNLKSEPHTETFAQTCAHLDFLLKDAITRQLVSDVPLCTFLSGGLDSSIITKYAADYCYENGLPPLNTYSIDYVDNDKNFVKSDFQPNSDNYYINLMVNRFHTNHHPIVIDTPELAEYLEDAMIARDMPGMADIDSSLLLFCKNVKPTATVSLTGECADEIFGGYPWFFREDALQSGTFPWSIAISERQTLLHPSIAKKVELKDYINYRYQESLSELEILDTDSIETAEKRKISHLTMNWFMQTLLDRSDRMAMYNGFELRVPFCDYRLAQYVWNIPWEIKALNGREKGLLRYVSRKYLPAEIVDRKKSPYPKTHNPTYLTKVKSMLSDIMSNRQAPINYLLNREYILNILETDGKAFSRPWFGQLMTGPQLMAYLCQVNMWLEKYKPIIKM